MQPAMGDKHPPIGQLQFRMTVRPGHLQLTGKLVKPGSNRNTPTDLPQAVAQEIFQAGRRVLPQSRDPCRLLIAHCEPVLFGQFVEQTGGFGEIGRRLRQRCLGRGEAPAEGDQGFVTKEIARQCEIAVAFILDPAQPMRHRIGLDFLPGNSKQRTQKAQLAETALGGHGGGTGHPGPPQQVVEQRFRLVAPMLRQQQTVCSALGEGCVARLAGGRFETKPHRQIDGNVTNPQGNADGLTVGDTKIRPGRSIGRKAMMNVHGREPHTQIKPAQEMEQDDRIAASGKADAQVFGDGKAGGDKIADPRDQVS